MVISQIKNQNNNFNYVDHSYVVWLYIVEKSFSKYFYIPDLAK